MDKIKHLLRSYAQAAICYGEYKSKDNLKEEKEERAALLLEIQTYLQAAQPQWQPIETAPKLGERFLVHCEGSHLEVAFNLRGEIIGDSGSSNLTLKDRGYNPTHWMPLPLPPQQ